MHLEQATRWTRTQSCSRSSSLAPNSTERESPPATNRAALPEDSKRNLSLTLDTATFDTEKGHWAGGGCVWPCSIHGQTVFYLSTYDSLQPRDLILGEDRRLSSYRPTPCSSLTVGVGKPMAIKIRHPQTPSQGHWQQTCLRTNRLRLLQTPLKRDCSSAT